MCSTTPTAVNLNYIELLREVGACFSVNRMLTAECYKQRMEKGLSFLEFNYMIMQSMTSTISSRNMDAICRSVAMTSGPICWGNGAHPAEAGKGRLCNDHHPSDEFRGQEDGEDRLRCGLAGPPKNLPL